VHTAVLPSDLPCDGCGLPATPEHIAERIRRLELATRFRPVRIGALFVALAPPPRPEDHFYGPAESKEFLDPFLDALGIYGPVERAAPQSTAKVADSERLAEFQKRGHYLAYLSECPVNGNKKSAEATVARLGFNLVRRIQLNYRPKHIVLLGQELLPLVEMIDGVGIGPTLLLDRGLPLPAPGTGGKDWKALFQRAVASVSPS
jgi:hypothetical protein